MMANMTLEERIQLLLDAMERGPKPDREEVRQIEARALALVKSQGSPLAEDATDKASE